MDFNAQWDSIITSSMFAENANLSVDGGDIIAIRGVYISGSFKEESSAAYAPKVYTREDYFRFSNRQLKGKLGDNWREVVKGGILELVERGLKLRVFDVIGGNQGDIEFVLQEIAENVAD